MMENRSFDHYFGHLSLPTSLGGEGRIDVDGFKGNEMQYLAQGSARTAFKPFAVTGYGIGDIDHEWAACHGQFNGGKMDGFIQMHFEDLERKRLRQPANCDKVRAAIGDPLAYYTRKDTPVFHQLLDNYTLCDRWFSSVMGPTWPNRLYLDAATSCGVKSNVTVSFLSTISRRFGLTALNARELADRNLGGPATLEQKRRATRELLGVFDRLGTASIHG